MKFHFWLILILYFPISLIGQIDVNSSHFKTTKEQDLYRNIDSTDLLELVLYINEQENIPTKLSYNKIKAEVDKIIWRHQQKSRYTKRSLIKSIFELVHNSYFKKYVSNPVFTDIYKNGNYNCATGTFMYAYIFERLDLYYEIRETNDHVYLITFDDKDILILESTAPGEDFQIYTNETIIEYKNHLKSNKLLDHDDDSFNFLDDFILQDSLIYIDELVGVLYNNLASKFLIQGEIENAINAYYKAYYLRPSKLITENFSTALFQLINTENIISHNQLIQNYRDLLVLAKDNSYSRNQIFQTFKITLDFESNAHLKKDEFLSIKKDINALFDNPNYKKKYLDYTNLIFADYCSQTLDYAQERQLLEELYIDNSPHLRKRILTNVKNTLSLIEEQSKKQVFLKEATLKFDFLNDYHQLLEDY